MASIFTGDGNGSGAAVVGSTMTWTDFPEDVQLTILSFLSAADVSAFASTCRRSRYLCRPDSRLWHALSHRRWGHLTSLDRWAPAVDTGGGAFRTLYRSLSRCEHLIGFWRRSGLPSSPLLFFEWGPSFIAGSRVSPPAVGQGYAVAKTPFLWVGLSPTGEPVNYLDPDQRFDFAKAVESGVLGSPDLVPVQVNFLGRSHLLVEEDANYEDGWRKLGSLRRDEGVSASPPGSPPEVVMTEIYQYFANRTSPGGDRALRKQRRKEKGRLGRRRLEAEHYVKIVDCSPTPSRPLQGLWKGICENMNLKLYFVSYDDIGGIACRTIGDSAEELFCYSPVFWTSDTRFIEAPFSEEEEEIYNTRLHTYPHIAAQVVVRRILYINSSYDLTLPELTSSSTNLRHVEGRIWHYEDGTFGIGFLRNNFVIDMKLVAENGRLLDAMEHPCAES